MIRKAWTSPDRFSHSNWHFDNVVANRAIQQPHPPSGSAPSAESIHAAREGYNPLLDQIAPDRSDHRPRRDLPPGMRAVGRDYDPMMVGVTRGLQIVHNEEERKRAIVTRRQVLKNIGDLACGPGAERYAHIKEDEDCSCSTTRHCSARRRRSSPS